MAKRTQRKDGRYSSQVYLGTDENGKRSYKTVYASKPKELEKKVREVKIQLGKGIDIAAQNDTWGEWAEQWLRIKKAEVSNGQYVSYKVCADKFKRYSDVKITRLRTIDFQTVINESAEKLPSTGKPASRRTLRGIKGTAEQICNFAIINRVMEYNPATAVKIPSTPPPEKRRALTDEEQGWIINTPHRAQIAAMIMMYAGLRRGELIPLTWMDIDLNKRTITVNKSVEIINGKSLKKAGGKTETSDRVVDIPQILVDYLRAQPRKTPLVCPSARGYMMSESSWKRLWESYITELNLKYGDFSKFKHIPQSKYDPEGVPLVIPYFTAHWLRHTFASILYMAGVDVLTAKEQLGHKSVKTTLEIYAHLDKEFKRRKMDLLDSYLGEKQGLKKKDKNIPVSG